MESGRNSPRPAAGEGSDTDDEVKLNIAQVNPIPNCDVNIDYLCPTAQSSYDNTALGDRSSRNDYTKCDLERDLLEEEIAIEERELAVRRKRLDMKRKALSKKHQPKPDTIHDNINSQDTASYASGKRSPDNSSLRQTLKQNYSAMAMSTLPKIEIDKFDGNPTKFWKFIRGFEMSVTKHLYNDNQKLMYLIHYCTGEAKEAIEHCVLLSSQFGFSKAMDILKTQFGRPHDIAEAFMKELLHGGAIAAEDVESLRKLVRKMMNCEMALTQMSYTADLNCSTNIKRIVQRLPTYIQRRWAEVADDILMEDSVPSFNQLVRFLNKRLSVATNTYGVAFSGGKPEFFGNDRNRSTLKSVTHHNIHALVTNRYHLCPICSVNHSLDACRKFISMNHRERLEVLKELKLCFNCFKSNHRAIECNNPARCTEPGCNKRHHKLLHVDYPEAPVIVSPGNVNTTRSDTGIVNLGFLPVRLVGPSGTVETYAFLDNGSDTTLILADVAERLGLAGPATILKVTTVNGTSSRSSTTVSFDVHSFDDAYKLNIEKAYTIDSVPLEKAYTPSERQLAQWPHLVGLNLPQMSHKGVSLLIGANVPEAHWVFEQRIGTSKQPYASLTALGWVILGPSGCGKGSKASVNCIAAEESIESDMLRMFASEFNDNRDTKNGPSMEDKHVLNVAEQSIRLIGGQYQVDLPWKTDWHQLPNNKYVAERRLQCLKTRLSRDSELLRKYTEIIVTHENKGYITKISEGITKDLRFVPHHPVLNPRKPGKVRIVFDCAAKSQGNSLNDFLYSGPDLTNYLTGVLIRFRQHEIALSADIEEMFLQVRLPPKDRPAFCFLWYPDGNLHMQPEKYQINVHPFGATSSPFCANFALKQTAKDNHREFDELTLRAVKDNFYVDDCLVSTRTAQDASKLCEELVRLLRLGGFRLHKWICNNTEVLKNIPVSERASELVNLNLSDPHLQKTLGLFWCVTTDNFQFKVNMPMRPATRRGILSCIASLYDPLGFVAPLLLRPKRLLQQLCQKHCGWDENVDDNTKRIWESWQLAIQLVESLKIPRCMTPIGFKSNHLSLHLFGDASETGYSAVAYLRCVSTSGHVHCSFIMGKSRVSPLKPITIPRLELQAAVLSVKLMRHIKNELRLKISATYLWTDSTIVLCYLLNTQKRFKIFVANRIGFILEHTTPSQWRHVSSNDNPADVGSRGNTGNMYESLKKWVGGPEFLQYDERFWPATDNEHCTQSIAELETRKETTIMNIITSEGAMDTLLLYYSSWSKLKRAVAWLSRFKEHLHIKYSRQTLGHKDRGPLRVLELKKAEYYVIHYVQRQTLSISSLVNETKDEPGCMRNLKGSPLRKLCPIIIDGLLCVGGRLGTSSLSYFNKHPIILPGDHKLVETIIREYYKLEGHMGMAHTLAVIRQKYWILRGAATIKRVLHRCVGCRMRSAKPVEQIMSDLPADRTEIGFPFAITGIDYFGPFYVKQGRANTKLYGCLFTCLKTRALHIEVSYSLSIDSFLMAFSRFSNRRGTPKRLYSDQGSNFVGAELELRQFMKSLETSKISDIMLAKEIDWYFNPPYASHRGGVWERLIRSIRRVLSAVLQEQNVTHESLTTYLTEVERILNNRPLVPVYDDMHQEDVLTPNHLLLPHNASTTTGKCVDLRERYTRNWRQAQLLADTFWYRWRKEYVATLQCRHKWTKVCRESRIGDVVLLLENKLPRSVWPKGVICDVTKGSDGHIRTIKVKTTSGIVTRDIRKTCLLEGVDEV